MPVMELGLIDKLNFGDENNLPPPTDLAIPLVGYRLSAYMTWPDDAERRNQYLASVGAGALGYVHDRVTSALPKPLSERTRRRLHESTLWKTIHDDYFMPFGGYSTASKAGGIDVMEDEMRNVQQSGWMRAGSIMWVARSIATHYSHIGRGGGGLNKAKFLLERDESNLFSRRQLRDAWASYSKVAHVCAAYYILHTAVLGGISRGRVSANSYTADHFFAAGVGTLLSVARDYQDWATTYLPHGRDEPILSPATTWLIPDGGPRFEMPLMVPTFSAKWLSTLETYEASPRKK